MTIETRYNLNQAVHIPAIDSPAIVRVIRYDGQLTYLVSYWADSKLQEAWLTESELETRQ